MSFKLVYKISLTRVIQLVPYSLKSVTHQTPLLTELCQQHQHLTKTPLSFFFPAMARSFSLLYTLSPTESLKSLFFIPTALALTSSLFILFYIYSTSNLFNQNPHHFHHFAKYPDGVLDNFGYLEKSKESQRDGGGGDEGVVRSEQGMGCFYLLVTFLSYVYKLLILVQGRNMKQI